MERDTDVILAKGVVNEDFAVDALGVVMLVSNYAGMQRTNDQGVR